MSNVFGPTFGDEVIAAGLGGLPFSWTPTGEIFGRENLTSEQNTTLDGVIAVHDPTLTAIPQQVSERQFHHALATTTPVFTRAAPGNGTIISQQEAIDAVSVGAVPVPIDDFIKSLPADQQWAAYLSFAGEATAKRYSPLMEQFRIFHAWTSRQMDDLFRYAATL
jgi:hypothetical protein